MIIVITQLLTGLVLLYLSYCVGVQFVFSVAARSAKQEQRKGNRSHRFVLFIPAYREDKVIVRTVEQALNQQYPPEAFSVVVIADSLQKSTVDQLQQYPIQLIPYSDAQRTKTKALRWALKQIPEDAFDLAVVVDADNQLAPDFLAKMNAAFQGDIKAAQGQRIAANEDTSVAILDAAAEAINHQIYCKGAQAMGVSARLMGSGMTFDLELFRSLINQIEAVGGFDKELEVELSRKKVPILYVEGAVIKDEKVRSKEVFTTQRKRWISAQFFYLNKYWKEALISLLSSQNKAFAFKVSLLAMPPRLVLPILVLAAFLGTSLMSGWSVIFATLVMIHFLTLFLALPARYLRKDRWKAWLQVLPLLLRTFGLLGKLKGANQSFIHTPHGD